MTFQPDPLDQRAAQEQREDACPEPTPLDLFMDGLINWQAFVALDDAYRAKHGLPPVPELTPEQERRMWLRIAAKAEAQREAEAHHAD